MNSESLKWFEQAKLGIFIHFGLYSMFGRGEWIMHQESIPNEEYAKFADDFDPVNFDADKWAKQAVKAGAKYMVMTARHHDGFCLYDSKYSDFNSVKTNAKRDFIKEFTDACRKNNLKVGIYYSWLDWRYDCFRNPDNIENFEKMIEQARVQIDELMSNYGKIDILWFDAFWSPDKEKEAMWHDDEIIANARKKQPGLLVNNRCSGDEDFDTPENALNFSAARPFEVCMTVCEGWGFVADERLIKTPMQVMQNFFLTVGGGGNFLINIGPKGDGTFATEHTEILDELAGWMDGNSVSLFGTKPWRLQSAHHGAMTKKGNTGYIIIAHWPGSEIVLSKITEKVKRAYLLEPYTELAFKARSNGRLAVTGMPAKCPTKYQTVLAVEFENEI